MSISVVFLLLENLNQTDRSIRKITCDKFEDDTK